MEKVYTYALLHGVPVIVIPDDGEQKKKHRKRRINKKWRKRYGVYHTGLKTGAAVIGDGFGTPYKIIMSKTVFNNLKRKCNNGQVQILRSTNQVDPNRRQ